MAKLNEMTDPAITAIETTENLELTMEKICSRIGHLFKNPLYMEYENNDYPFFLTGVILQMFIGRRPRFFIYEMAKKCLGIIPTGDSKLLLEVSEYSGIGIIFSSKKLNCTVYDPKILTIVKEELNKFADAHGIAEVDITKEF